MRLTNAICELLTLWEEVNKTKQAVDNMQSADYDEKEQVQIKLDNLNNRIRMIMSDLRVIRKKYVYYNTSTPSSPNIGSDEESQGRL